MSYQFIISEKTEVKLKDYCERLIDNPWCAGALLDEELHTLGDVSSLTTKILLQFLVNTKQPRIFAESEIYGDGSDWNLDELSILGDISCAVPVNIFDNGHHTNPKIHNRPLNGHLLFTPGALLRNDTGNIPADWLELVYESNKINERAYYELYERRLLPLLLYASKTAHQNKQKALVTIPGLGCGCFSGPFNGLANLFALSLKRLLETHYKRLPYIECVYFDPYSTGHNDEFNIGHIKYRIRPLLQGNENKSQLSEMREFKETMFEFRNTMLFSVVAWDHGSWPGNDFYDGSRTTDDGVKAAATDSMTAITGVKGEYDPIYNHYNPVNSCYSSWRQVVEIEEIKLCTANTIRAAIEKK